MKGKKEIHPKEKKKILLQERETWDEIIENMFQDKEKIIEQINMAKKQFPELIHTFVLLMAYSQYRYTQFTRRVTKSDKLVDIDESKKKQSEHIAKWIEKRISDTQDEEEIKTLKNSLNEWQKFAAQEHPYFTEMVEELQFPKIDYSNIFKELFGKESLELRSIEGDFEAIKKLGLEE